MTVIIAILTGVNTLIICLHWWAWRKFGGAKQAIDNIVTRRAILDGLTQMQEIEKSVSVRKEEMEQMAEACALLASGKGKVVWLDTGALGQKIN